MDEYDPSHPAVVFTVFKWYMNPEAVGDMLLEQYPIPTQYTCPVANCY